MPLNLQIEANKIDQDATAVAVGGNGDGNTTANAGNKADIDSNDDLTSTIDYGGDHFLFGGGPLVNVGVEANIIVQNATAVAVGGLGDGNTTANAFNDADIDSNDDLTSMAPFDGFDFMAVM